MIAASPDVEYIQEPFNLRHDVGISRARFNHWFPYVSWPNEVLYYKDIRDTVNFRYNWSEKLKRVRSPRGLWCVIRNYLTGIKHRCSGVRPLLKDPIAVFSAEWLQSRFNMDVVVLIRHPAAFAGSIKVKNWTYPFAHFLEQPLLMKDYLHPFERDIQKFARQE